MISICAFSVSARKSLSFIVSMNALRSAATRSAGMFGRRQERPAHHLAGEDQPQDLPLLVGLGEIDDQRHVRQVGMLVERELHQDVNFFSSSHFWWVDFTLDHDQPQRPCTSPRSMARPTSLPPG